MDSEYFNFVTKKAIEDESYLHRRHGLAFRTRSKQSLRLVPNQVQDGLSDSAVHQCLTSSINDLTFAFSSHTVLRICIRTGEAIKALSPPHRL